MRADRRQRGHCVFRDMAAGAQSELQNLSTWISNKIDEEKSSDKSRIGGLAALV